ncbi:MAG: hypothetical protein LAT55_10950 [Opitutales bacterium]|nr:hypothetical protein [Opitutales bacterium]
MKKLISFLALIVLASCAKKEEKESTSWALSIQANTGTREQKQSTLNGRIRYILDGVEGTKEIPEYDLPISAVLQFQADRVLAIELDEADYDYPVFLNLIRYENLNEIKWPEEAQGLQVSRFLYARNDDLRDGFKAIPESSPIEVKRRLDKDSLTYGHKDDLTRKQFIDIFSEIAPEVNFDEREGWASTVKEKYDTDLLIYSSDSQGVGLEFQARSRKDESRLESIELQIVFPIGEYQKNRDLIRNLTNLYIEGFLNSVLSEPDQVDWLTKEISTPVHSKFDGRILEVGDYVLTTYRVYWDYIEPVEHLGLWITTKP